MTEAGIHVRDLKVGELNCQNTYYIMESLVTQPAALLWLLNSVTPQP